MSEIVDTTTQLDELHQQRGMGGDFGDVPGAGGMDASELVESLLSNEHIPSKLRKDLWVLFGKSTKLTFLTEEDIYNLMLEFELLRLTIIESLPKSFYNEELERDLIMIRMEFELNLKRSKGGHHGLNERELLGSSTSATFSERSNGHGAEEPGFFDRISRLLGGH